MEVVEDLVFLVDKVIGVVGVLGIVYFVGVVVLIIGMFLCGEIYIGEKWILVGWVGDWLLIGFFDIFYGLDFDMG